MTTRRVHNADYASAEEALDEFPRLSWWWDGPTLFVQGPRSDVERAIRTL